MRILVISKEVWRDDQNGGNTLTSLFRSFPSDTEYAQIFCSEGTPDNLICHNYFKLSTSTIVDSIKHGDLDDGNIFDICTSSNAPNVENNENPNLNMTSLSVSDVTVPVNNFSIKARFKNLFNKELFREIIWLSGKYKSDKLRNYITDFNPDIIFAPGYGVHYMNHLIQWICSFTSCPVVSLISDDYFTYSIRSFNPFYWLNQPFLRHNVRKSAACYNLVYTMTGIQKLELEKDLKVDSKVLLKSASFDNFDDRKQIHSPLRLIYAGSLYSNRWKTLRSLAKAIDEINASLDRIAVSLDIYSGSVLSDKSAEYFNSSDACRLLPPVPYDTLIKLHNDYDIALHVEGFDIRSKAKVRMSFSTKIIDCLASGCATMCICDEMQGGLDYIKSNDLGICVTNPSKTKETLLQIINNPAIIDEYRLKAHNYGLMNHNQEEINAEMYEDFCRLVEWRDE